MKEIVKVTLFSKDTSIFEIYDDLCKTVGRTTYLAGVPEATDNPYEWVLPFPTVSTIDDDKERVIMELLLERMFYGCQIKEAWIGKEHLVEHKSISTDPNYHALNFSPNTESSRAIVSKVVESIGIGEIPKRINALSYDESCFAEIIVYDEHTWDEHVDDLKRELNFLLVTGVLTRIAFRAKGATQRESAEKDLQYFERFKAAALGKTKAESQWKSPTKEKCKSEYALGAKQAQDLIVAKLCGWQNGMGHNNPDDPEYKAYQRVIEEILNMQKEK